jgi:predicted metal-dependent peptidase
MTITRDNLRLIINPPQYFDRPEEEQQWILIHEVLHFLFKHPWRSKLRGVDYSKKEPAQWLSIDAKAFIENLAMDLAINSYMKNHFSNNHPAKIPMPAAFGLPEQKSFEFYFHQLMKAAKCPSCGIPILGGGKGKSKGKGEGEGRKEKKCDCGKAGKELQKWMGSFFGHAWKIGCDDVQANTLAARYYRHGERMAGAAPAGALRDVYKVEAQADFRDVIMRVAQSSELSDEQMFHKRRISRRYGRPPGSRYEALGEVHILQDTSGSMGPHDIGACYSVMDKLRRMGYDIYIYEFDAAFHGPEYKYTGTPPKVKGGGGTMMMSTLKYISETRPHIKQVIVFTDSYVGDIPKEIPFTFESIVFCIPEWVDERVPDWLTVVKYKSERHE